MDIKTEPYKDYLYVHFSGKYKGLIPEDGHPSLMMEECKKNNISNVLVDIRELKGNLPLNLRLTMAKEFGKIFRNTGINIAIVKNSKPVYKDRIFQRVTNILGVNVNVFDDSDKAMDWLM